MAKKLIAFALMVALIAAQPVLAKTASQQLEEVNKEKAQTQSSLQTQKNNVNKALQNIKKTEEQIDATEVQLDVLEQEIAELIERIASKEDQIKMEEERLAIENENVNKMVNYMFYQDDYTALSLLLESENIIDALTNLDMYQIVQESNMERIQKIEVMVEDLKNQKTELDQLRRTLKTKETNLEARKDRLMISKSETEAYRQAVIQDISKLEKQIDALNSEAEALISKIRSEQSSTKVYAGGELLWPVPSSSKITSPYGYRIHPILKTKKMHSGIDIGTPSGKDIVAANSGTVLMATYNSSYGNVILIDHGGGIATLYAHCSKLLVLKGDEVARGQVIALIGSTGMSTGPHLHFEVRKNGQFVNPMDWLQ